MVLRARVRAKRARGSGGAARERSCGFGRCAVAALGPFSCTEMAAAAAPAAPPPTLAQEVLGPPPQLPTPAATAAWNQANALARFDASTRPAAAAPMQARASALDRQLRGPVFAASSGPGSSAEIASAPPPMGNGMSGPPWAVAPSSTNASERSPAAAGESLETLLRPSVMPAVEARCFRPSASFSRRVLHRLHARDGNRLDAAWHDDVRHGHRYIQR